MRVFGERSEVGGVCGFISGPPALEPGHETYFVFDGTALQPTAGPAEEPLPRVGRELLRTLREQHTADEDARNAVAIHRARAEHAGFIVATTTASASHTTEAFEGTGIFAPTKAFVSGWEGDGKSALMLEAAFALSTGSPLFGIFPNALPPARVWLIQTEMADAEQERRLDAIKERESVNEAPNLYRISQEAGCTFDLSQPVHRDRFEPSESRLLIEKRIEEFDIEWLLLDPLYELIGAADISDRNMQMPGIMKWLASLQARNVSTLSVIMGDPKRGLDGIFGSKHQRMHTELLVACDRSDVRGTLDSNFTFRVTPKRYRDLYPKTTFRLRGTGVGQWEQIAKPAEDEPTEKTTTYDTDAIRDSLTNEPDLAVRARSEKLGIPTTTLYRLIKKIEASPMTKLFDHIEPILDSDPNRSLPPAEFLRASGERQSRYPTG